MARYRDPGPPGDGSGPAPPREPDHAASAATKHLNTASLNGDALTVTALRRRREASWRIVPLDCGCRDPWRCRCTSAALSAAALDGWRDAAQHILANGWIPLLPLEVRRALLRRQGADRLLAKRLHQACGEVAS
jgi:hypothetical protein